MSGVQRALHILTGKRASGEAINAWLAQHGVQTEVFADVYEACAYLLQRYEGVPDLVLVGLDWLNESEVGIVRYVREVWPRCGLILYGSFAEGLLVPGVPMSRACRHESALRGLLAETPAEVLAGLWGQAGPMLAPAASLPAGTPLSPVQPAVPSVAVPVAVEMPVDEVPRESWSGLPAAGLRPPEPPVASGPPRAILTAEELAALLDSTDQETTRGRRASP